MERRLAVKRGCLDRVCGRSAPILQHQRQVIPGLGVSLVRSETVKPLGLGLVLGDATARLVGETKIVLRIREPLVRGLLEPEGSLEGVLGHPCPDGVHVAHVELRGHVPELRGAHVIPEGRLQVALCPVPRLGEETEVEEGRGIARVGRTPEVGQSLDKILRQSLSRRVGVAESVEGFDITRRGLALQRRDVHRLRPRGNRDLTRPQHDHRGQQQAGPCGIQVAGILGGLRHRILLGVIP